MLYSEFLELSGANPNKITADVYANRIEPVYMYHPRLQNISKTTFIDLYKLGLMPDLYAAAEIARRRDEEIAALHRQSGELADRVNAVNAELDDRIAELKNERNQNYDTAKAEQESIRANIRRLVREQELAADRIY